VKGANHHLFGSPANQAFGALAHFGSGFVGEGDGGDALPWHAHLDQAANLMGDYAGFSRACAGKNQTGAMQVIDRLLLGKVHGGRGGGRHAKK
jgi:hypothetical protein